MIVGFRDYALEAVTHALGRLRFGYISQETDVDDGVSDVLKAAGIPFEREKRLSREDVIDFLAMGCVGIECKKNPPNAKRLFAQVTRYCSHDAVEALVVVLPKRYHLPRFAEANGRPVVYVVLSELWGYAV